MPVIQMNANFAISKADKDFLAHSFGKAIEDIPGKTEERLMVDIEDRKDLYYKGNGVDKAVFIEVKLYGKENVEAFSLLTKDITDIVNKMLSVEPNNVYVAYFPTTSWGKGGQNF